ncbi:MAG: hypothetical protein A2268_12525 [Candidatus Raymondbacteria bacterium RifOxyA12_full_50_37]|uniref:Cupin 2 conserved barrel domain-containing protein n=1 Tax=Candidatus Raymondbacteria bacterium RIFOXYD12_FULL_49_13 TaxID=1817890 RepID=A0A1F7F0J0_UNCRA|nr:MAG: hypothetical protein A2248_16010 [Candidatus Raymondbacteria bacterium RIFOXYA2_FULL_49_16]OGJ91957.1 MAG: hypothetical protein A2268_12525 [Candidatus Raymondbacteria bacterium RifOxyA12_full_50_37]OGK00138.1 MAG: hypothetical protein A2519_22090 [Candidatus Raymondbacteria bacterium RIFOXYD12_FULL_49_13]OGP40058.1 MAG: hypothetical protein A2324_00100 [Candidatus Raymondbacteria bacterium RIFOXYB2_FULL_49_35]
MCEMNIPIQKFKFRRAGSSGPRVMVKEFFPGEVPEVCTTFVSLNGPSVRNETGGPSEDLVLLFLEGKGVLRANGMNKTISAESICRIPVAQHCELRVKKGHTLHYLAIRKTLDQQDMRILKKRRQVPYFRRYKECEAYGEAIKSAKTVNRTLLAETIVPRLAMGTVETTGPDAVAAHAHPMLEQYFLGLADNHVTVSADGKNRIFTGNCLLRIPSGSTHSVLVRMGRRLRYVWMDFFASLKGVSFLKTHTRLGEKKTK